MQTKKDLSPDAKHPEGPPAPMTDWRGHALPMGRSKAERRSRCRHYLSTSFIGGLCYALLDVLLWSFVEDSVLAGRLFPTMGRSTTILVTAAVAFVVVFLSVFLFSYLTGEFIKVRRYHQLRSAQAQADASK